MHRTIEKESEAAGSGRNPMQEDLPKSAIETTAQGEAYTYLGNPVEFYPKAPDRKPTDTEINNLNNLVKVTALWLFIRPNEVIDKSEVLVPNGRDTERISFTWNYRDETVMGSLPEIDSIIFKPEQGVVVFKSTNSRGEVVYGGVSAVNLLVMRLSIW